MRLATSRNGVPIRLTDERWVHIVEEHSELAGYLYDVLETVERPEIIYEGSGGELLGTAQIEDNKYLVVVYRELSRDDGFVITAFLTRRVRQLERRRKLWPR